ncbi:MAG: WD40/YVTN/BNR-like repeat-containing protein [Actinomycetota bacterium]
MLLSIAVVSTLLTAGGLEGAVPGKAPILGLASIDAGFIVGTESGVYVSANGKSWSKGAELAGKPVLVTGVGRGRAAILAGGRLYDARRLSGFLKGQGAPQRAVALAGDPAGSIYISSDSGHLLTVAPGGDFTTQTLGGGPDEVVALDVVPPNTQAIFTGGLNSGVWRRPVGEKWRQILKTPTRAVLVDDKDPRRIFIATAGGILVSKNQGLSWLFTEMRLPVEALAQHGATYFALGENRLLYKSADGRAWNVAI